MSEISSSYAKPRPSGGLELWSWFFMRLSGVALLFLALGHLYVMHISHNVDEINYAFVATRYKTWFWRGYDLALIILALIHGANGARILLDDYIHLPRQRRFLGGALAVVCGVLLLLGVLVTLFFKPAALHYASHMGTVVII